MKPIIVKCGSCGTKNRVTKNKKNEKSICGRCGSALIVEAPNRRENWFKNKWAWLVLTGVPIAAFLANSPSKTGSTTATKPPHRIATQAPEVASAPAQRSQTGVNGSEVDAGLAGNDVDWSASLPKDEYCEAQELLSYLGFYTGRIDGIWGPGSRQAIRLFGNWYSSDSSRDSSMNLMTVLRKYSLEVPVEKRVETRSRHRNTVSVYILQDSRRERIAPLEIRTSASQNYLIKLENVSNGIAEMMFFVRGGATANLEVPLGRYRLKYAVGQTLFSEKCLFGVETQYYQTDRMFEFQISGNRISGYTVELILQAHGNLSTSETSRESW